MRLDRAVQEHVPPDFPYRGVVSTHEHPEGVEIEFWVCNTVISYSLDKNLIRRFRDYDETLNRLRNTGNREEQIGILNEFAEGQKWLNIVAGDIGQYLVRAY